MADRLLFDTTILVDHLRGNERARRYIQSASGMKCISVITRAELFAGVFDADEQTKVEALLSVFRVFDVTARIAEQGGYFKRDFQPSHETGLADALIAATAAIHEAQLVTLSVKHFPMLGGRTRSVFSGVSMRVRPDHAGRDREKRAPARRRERALN